MTHTKISIAKIKIGEVLTFVDEDEAHLLEVDFNPNLPSWANPFRCWFNCKLFSFKTFQALENKVNRLCREYTLREDGLWRDEAIKKAEG